ncbi:diacylglycerol kinase family protein [Sanguibacter sp. 25GB23B1]|uniref:diacylglycerol/lipid kinase family protein n=1 Tax=unclassified Sanguibacter TaxID=2645534 RepID=UPI0032AFAA74
MGLEGWLLTAAIVVALVAIGLTLVLLRQHAVLRAELAARETGQVSGDDVAPSGPLLAFVANPSKNGAEAIKVALFARCAAERLPEPLWLETTVEDPGVGQTREALDRGADLVVAVGGDGTVRAVAEGMVGTGTPMALLPLGTGNLLARNLDISVTDREEAFDIILKGRDRSIDVGWLQVLVPAPVDPEVLVKGSREKVTGEKQLDTGPPDPEVSALAPADTKKHIFLVIAGLGFDAAMVADTDATLKSKVGWMAYFLAGARHLHGRRVEMTITLDEKPPVHAKLRTLMVGNCGKLPGGITLIPDAVIDDGIHDVAAIDTRGGIMGWAQLFGEVVMQGFGLKNDLPNKIGRIDHARAEQVLLRVERGEQVQVDGDVLGRAVEVRTWVEPLALVVRSPIPRLGSR